MKQADPAPLFSLGRKKKTAEYADFLAALEEKLPDKALAALFPDLEVREARRLLRGAVAELTGENSPEDSPSAKIAARKPPPSSPPKKAAEKFALYTDGASRGNPGEAGAGLVILDEEGNEIIARSFYLGQCSNNVAEYRALIAGLRAALELGCQQLDIFMDSQLIIRQVQGRYKVKNAGLKPLFAEVRQLLAKLASFTINHVPRSENRRADELANRGIDER